MKTDPALKSNRSPSGSNSAKPSQEWGTGLRKEATFLLFQAAEPGGAVSSFDLQVKGLPQPLRSPSNDKGVITELSKVTNVFKHWHFIILQRQYSPTPNVWERGTLYRRGGFLTEGDPPKA